MGVYVYLIYMDISPPASLGGDPVRRGRTPMTSALSARQREADRYCVGFRV